MELSAQRLRISFSMASVLGEILEWSKDRPLWQRDALRRLVTGVEITDAVIDELKELCKLSHGLAKDIDPIHLSAEHAAPERATEGSVMLDGITHHSGVNALAAEQTIKFGPNLTIVFGRNAAGKSGYTRILKRACRSRHPEDILGNVLSGETPVAANATIAFHRGDEAKSFAWTQNATPDDDLAAVSVFDAQSAAVYLKDKTDVAFRPFGLDIFDRLSTICGQVRARLEQEQRQLENGASTLPSIPEGTRVKSLLDGLTALTNVDEVRGLGTLSNVEQQRLVLLRAKLTDFRANNPKARGQELSLKAVRLNNLFQHVVRLGGRVSSATLTNFKAADAKLAEAQRSLEAVRSAAFPEELLNGTGGQEWFRLWEAAQAFSSIAYPVTPFPATADARCVLCQQPLGEDARKRFEHFAEFARSNAQVAVQTAQGERETTRRMLIEPAAKLPEAAPTVEELKTDSPELAASVESYLDKVAAIQQDVEKTVEGEGIAPPEPPIDALRAVIIDIQERAATLLREEPTLDEKEQQELKELEARAILAGVLQLVINEIERKKKIAAYRQCLDDTTTNAVTRKSTDLTKALVTDQLQDTFKKEIAQIDFTDLAVEIQPAGGARGALYHRIVFSNAPGVTVASVLSEGESRALSLAAFMTELSTSDVRSAIVFDDPVSSLDHIWRDRIARRLTVEAKNRQVIVFTHDLVFLRALMDNADKQSVAYQHQYVRRESGPGVSSSDLPWFAMRIKERIGVLRNEWQAADKDFRAGLRDAYERAACRIYGRLREAWEQAVGEVLLNDVVERFRPSIETQRVRVLSDIQEGDCKAVDDGMTECSRWIIGHDHAAAEDAPVPEPAELKKQIDGLDTWVKSIRQRRS